MVCNFWVMVLVIEKTVVRAVSGFTKRLDEVLEHAGFRAYGRQKAVSHLAGLSYPAVKKMYAEDRPPRLKSFHLLLDNLQQAIFDINGASCTRDELQDYLLLSRGSFKSVGRQADSSADQESGAITFDIADFVRKDPVFTSQIIIAIENVASHEGVNTSVDLSASDMRLIQYRIVNYCHKNAADPKSEKVSGLISSLLELAKQERL